MSRTAQGPSTLRDSPRLRSALGRDPGPRPLPPLRLLRALLPPAGAARSEPRPLMHPTRSAFRAHLQAPFLTPSDGVNSLPWCRLLSSVTFPVLLRTRSCTSRWPRAVAQSPHSAPAHLSIGVRQTTHCPPHAHPPTVPPQGVPPGRSALGVLASSRCVWTACPS